MIMIYLLLILLNLIILHIVLRYNETARYYNKIPGPRPLPFLGNLLLINCSLEQMRLLLRKLSKDYYPIYKIWYVKSAMVMIQHPDDIKLLLLSKTNLEKSSGYDNIKFFTGTGILLSKTNTWKQRRKIISPAFSPAMLKINSGTVSEHAKTLITYIKSQGDKTIQNVVPLFKKLAMGIICDTTMGVNINKLEIKGRENFIYTVDFVAEVSLYRLARPYIKDWMMNFLPVGREQSYCIKNSHAFRDKIIQERRKYYENTVHQKVDHSIEEDSPYGVRNRGQPLIDILLSAEKKGLMNAQDVGDEVVTIITAGYDTTALTVSYTLLLLAKNKEIQELARAEVLEILNQSDSKILDREIQKLEYLDRCVKETLRILPIFPNIARTLSEGLQLKNYYIPANTEVIVNIYDLHRDPNFWPEPDKYDPDRFLPERVRERHPFAYIPFSAGIRNCIGLKYALMSIKNIVAHILINFDVEPTDKTADIEISLDFLRNTMHPIRLKFVKRNLDTE